MLRPFARRLQCTFQRLAAAGLLAVSIRVGMAESVVIGVIGDFGGAAQGPTFASNELAVANLVKRWNPDFIITTGDNNYREGAASTIDANIGQFYHEYIHPYLGSYGAGASSNRFFPCLGNHDWTTSNGLPYRVYFTLPGNERYYNYRQGPVELFALNSNPDVDGSASTSVQGRWLQAQLAASTARWKLVYLHHSPYAESVGGEASPNFRWPYAAWGASAALAGHRHIYARIHTNSMVYFINGLGGESIQSFASGANTTQVRYNGDYGAMRLQATESNLVFHFVTRNNTVIDTFVMGDPIWSPFILSHPLSRSAVTGRTVTFNVMATGAATLRYQWQFNSADIPSATNRSLVVTNVQQVHEGGYAVIVSSGTASTRSANAQLSVLRHPLIVQQPQNQTVTGGATITLHVAAEGAGALRYQWFFNNTLIAGATATNLSLTNVQLNRAGDYTVLVTDDIGSILSDPARLKILVRPVITLQPLAQSVTAGELVVFSVSAMGTLPMNYSWRRNGFILTNIVLNQSTCFLTIWNVQTASAGDYQVGIINEAGPSPSLSSSAGLTVLSDADGDGIPDTWELAYGLASNDATDAALDADGDGSSNLEEYRAGTDPDSAKSCLRIESISLASGGASRIEFIASSNKTYALEFREQTQTGQWQLLEEITAAPTNRVIEVIDPGTADSHPGRFYRLLTPRLP
jgi:hypothetical protein